MINKGDIKDILLVLLLAAIAVGISEGAEYLFYEYLHNDSNNIVEESREEKSISNSFCYPSLGKDMQPVTKCRSGTPEVLMKLRGYMPTRRV
jgi:hypothetical protein